MSIALLPNPLDALPLSRREKDVVALLFEDLPGKAIAARLGLRYETERSYMKNIRRKLGVQTRSGVVLRVLGYPPMGMMSEQKNLSSLGLVGRVAGSPEGGK